MICFLALTYLPFCCLVAVIILECLWLTETSQHDINGDDWITMSCNRYIILLKNAIVIIIFPIKCLHIIAMYKNLNYFSLWMSMLSIVFE